MRVRYLSCVHSQYKIEWDETGASRFAPSLVVLPLRIDSDQPQFFPAAIHNIPYTEIELAAHDRCVWFPGKTVEMLETDAVNLVVHVETANDQY